MTERRPLPRRSLLVLGYGNPLRGDDGVGPRVAQAVADWNLPGVEALALQQLTPELAETMASAAAVIFVDAATGAETHVPLQELSAAEVRLATTSAFHHHLSPAVLLGMAEALYGGRPSAWWLKIPTEQFGLGNDLSPGAERGMEVALRTIRQLIAERL